MTTRVDLFHRKYRVMSNGCWEWTAHVDATSGYGRFDTNRTREWAHRASYQLNVGPIPRGMQIDHLCRNRRCVNPAHLEAVTQRTNILRSNAPNAIVVRTNRCVRDHELTPENTYLRPDGAGRQCRECIHIRSARQTAKRQVWRAARIADPGTPGLDGAA